MTEVVAAILAPLAILGWLMYFRENQYRRDVLTDLMQVVYDHDLERDDLRRSLGYDEVENALERFDR